MSWVPPVPMTPPLHGCAKASRPYDGEFRDGVLTIVRRNDESPESLMRRVDTEMSARQAQLVNVTVATTDVPIVFVRLYQKECFRHFVHLSLEMRSGSPHNMTLARAPEPTLMSKLAAWFTNA